MFFAFFYLTPTSNQKVAYLGQVAIKLLYRLAISNLAAQATLTPILRSVTFGPSKVRERLLILKTHLLIVNFS